ncbi:diguanylate cyclase (GGDEF)-like protein [Hoeflea marina]|uniref:diguanylate cyclase n=1 Tax=Hoeflea marina TaxID=274592 RepID=A0A317PN81_9HYPH|nr:diguanylate cyclase [Hoeflea marina]PWW01711.1 diguanylate cyclase (GGDEF)-like protein [Hoeflea marina]
MSSVSTAQPTSQADQCASFETVFDNVAKPSVHVIGSRDFLLALTYILEPLNYRSSSIRRKRSPATAQTHTGPGIFIIDGSLQNALDLCQGLGEEVPKILVSPVNALAFRLECARAHVSTIISDPMDPAELVYWLEHFGGQMDDKPASVLLVDDDPLILAVYSELLRANGMNVAVLSEPLAIIETIDRAFFDIIIMDLRMPGTDGIEIAKIIRQHQNHLSIPIVFLSSEEDKSVQMRARRFGGDDFISKRSELNALVPLINLRVKRARVMRSLIERDGLTGLLNHRSFKERVGYEIARASRTGLPFCVAMIDVDHFKKVNDTWGHPVGDQVLTILARTLVRWVRNTDVVGRYGGEEFAVLLLDTSPEAVFQVLEKFRQHFSEILFDGQGEQFSLTVSIGIAGNAANSEAATLIAEADRALYLAKNTGRNQLVIAHDAGQKCSQFPWIGPVE